MVSVSTALMIAIKSLMIMNFEKDFEAIAQIAVRKKIIMGHLTCQGVGTPLQRRGVEL